MGSGGTMKKLLAAGLLYILLSGHVAAADLDGVLGVMFGASPTQVDQALDARGITFKSATTGRQDFRYYSGGSFSGMSLNTTIVTFYQGKANGVGFFFGPVPEISFMETMEEITTGLNTKYPDATFKDESKFVSPYTLGDGSEVSAIKLGKGTISRYWFLSPTRKISLGNLHENFIGLSYFATELSPPPASDY